MIVRFFSVFALWLLLFLSVCQVVAQEQESFCISCHTEFGDDLAEPVSLWRESIHRQNDISCASCHGGNPQLDDMEAMSPEEGFVGSPAEEEIPQFCGKCHVAVMQNYMKSPHWLTEKEKRPVCTTCHTAHHQQRAALKLISEENCGKCHSYERAKKIRFVMEGTEARIEQLDGSITEVRNEGFDTESIEAALFANRNQFHQLTHVLSVDLIIDKTDTISNDLNKIADTLKEDETTIKNRKIFGGILVAFLFVSALVLHIYRKTLS